MRHRAVSVLLVATGFLLRVGWSADQAPGSPARQLPKAALPYRIVFTRIPVEREARAKPRAGGMLRAGYGDGARIELLAPNGTSRNLTPDFASAADPEISFDGKRVLFAGKKSASDNWDIYEMDAGGANIRRITSGLGDCRSPIYQSPIFYLDDPGPMPQIAFVSDQPPQLGEYGHARSTSLYSARLDGSGVRRLTYVPSGAFDPVMLPDGRMMFSAWQGAAAGEDPRGRVGLFGINIDGTDYATFSGNQGRRVQHMGCVTSKRLVLFVDAETVGWDGGGPLAIIDLRRNLHTYRRLAVAGEFHSPAPLPDGTALVAWRPAGGAGTYGIYRLDPANGTLQTVVDLPYSHEIQAHAVAPRDTPDGRSSVVDETQGWAKLYCLSVYETDLDSKAWPKGLVKRLRVLEALPRTPEGTKNGLSGKDGGTADSLSPLIATRFIGEVDVDEDGSFQLQVPPNVPLQVQALDADGMALRSSAWIWVKNKEQRGCIGCHEDGERTPENVMATALTRPAANLVLPPERRRTIEFERDIAPILRRTCATAACHGGTAAPRLSGNSARFSAAYEGLLARTAQGGFRYVTPGRARTSPLVWALLGRNTSRPWDHTAVPAGNTIRRMPPAGSEPLTEEEKRAIIEWIDAGAHFNGLPGEGRAGSETTTGGQR